MDPTSPLGSVTSTRIALAGTLAAFAGYLVASDSLRVPVLAVMTLAAAVVVARGVGALRGTSVSAGAGLGAAGSAVGLVGAVLYLRSLADEPSAIPLVGVFVLLVSLVGLVVSLFTVRSR